MSTARVDFTRGAAERIARVVRLVEQGERDQAGPRYGQVADAPGGKVFRICSYTGAWSIGSTNTVTFKNQTTTPNTVSATNLFLPLPNLGTRDCAIAKDGSAWYLLQAQFDTAAFISNATLTTAALEFTRHNGLALGTATTVSVSVTTCSTSE